MEEGNPKGPLADINVVDFGHYYAGPLVGMLLADQGANVVRIVKPGKQEMLSPQFDVINRNKRIIELDLKGIDEQDKVRSLLEKADVVIENFRPGIMSKLGLDYSNLRKINPRIIYLSLPGFSSTDLKRANIQAWEGVLSAAAGIYVEANAVRKNLGYPPVYTSVPICSSYGSMHGAIAVMSALVRRETSGKGTNIEVPLVDAGLSSCTDSFIFKGSKGSLRSTVAESETIPHNVAKYSFSEDDSRPIQMEKLSKGFEELFFTFTTKWYQSSDGRKMLVFLPKPYHVTRFFSKLGIYHRLLKEGFVNQGPWEKGFDNDLANQGALSPDRTQYVKEVIAEALSKKTAADWEKIMAEAGVPFAVLRTRGEWLKLDPLIRSGVLAKMTTGLGALTMPGRIADVSGQGGRVHEVNFAPPIFVDRQYSHGLFISESFKEHHSNAASSPVLEQKGDLLKGLKVLDLCSIVAGPTSAYTLAQYGAEVIRVEPPSSFNLPLHLPYTLEVNQGKRSIVLDIKTQPGREVFRKLVLWADVLLHNRIDDIANRLGVSYDQINDINPDVVVCQFTALGGTLRGRGGWEGRLGFDPMANAPSGLLSQYGNLAHPMPFGGVSADLMGGLGLAFSALLGIYQRARTGYAGEGRASLARATNHNQFPWMIAKDDNADWGVAHGQFSVGEYWWQRMYQCKDRWIYVGATRDQAEAFSLTVTNQKFRCEKDLEDSFVSHDSNYWVTKIRRADIACHTVVSLDDLCDDNLVRRVPNNEKEEIADGALEVLRWDNHPCGTPIILPSPSWVRVGEGMSYKRLSPAPRVGQHTKEVLEEIGYADNEIMELIRNKVAYEFLPAIGSKDKYFF